MPTPTPSGESTVALAFSDAEGFQAWREQLPLINVALCQSTVHGQARELVRASLPAIVRFELLELMRELAAPLQAAYARKYLGRSVPLDDDDRAAWNNVVGLWSRLAAGYDALIDAMAGEAPELAGDAARICQRALRCTSRAMLEHSRVYRRIPGTLWRQLHRLHEFAENAGIAQIPVQDAVERTGAPTACATEYLQAIMTQLAQPDALSERQIDAVDRWLESWAPLVRILPVPPPAGPIPAIVIDPASDHGASLAEDSAPAGARYLQLDDVSRVLRQAAAVVRQGQTPAGLGLGEISREACEKLLMLLHVQWCAAGTGRAEERSGEGIVVTIAPNLAAIHYHLTGRAFRQPGGEITARERQDMDMLGYISEGTDRAMVSQRSATVETWIVVNKSASGFLGMCRDPNPATHIGHNQLLGLRNPSNNNLYLGTVQRLAVDDAGGIWVGLRLITASAQAAAARNPDARGPEAARYDRAVLVPGDPARKVAASVLLSPGWFATGRQLDLYRDRPGRIQLQSLMDKGPNFERATYTAV